MESCKGPSLLHLFSMTFTGCIFHDCYSLYFLFFCKSRGTLLFFWCWRELKRKNNLVWAVCGIWGLRAVPKMSQGSSSLSRSYYLNGVELATKVEVQATKEFPKILSSTWFLFQDSFFASLWWHCLFYTGTCHSHVLRLLELSWILALADQQ